MCSSSARQDQQTEFLSWQDTLHQPFCLFFGFLIPALCVAAALSTCTCSAEQQVLCRIKARFPFKFLWLSREQLLIFTCHFVLSVPGESSLRGACVGRDILTLPCLPVSTQRAAAGHHTTSCLCCACPAPVPVFPEEAAAASWCLLPPVHPLIFGVLRKSLAWRKVCAAVGSVVLTGDPAQVCWGPRFPARWLHITGPVWKLSVVTQCGQGGVAPEFTVCSCRVR